MQKPDIKALRSQKIENVIQYINEFCLLDTTQRTHKSIHRANLCEKVLEDYVRGLSIYEISKNLNISTSIIHKLLTDFYLYVFDDERLQELNFLENKNHLGVLFSFFNSVFNLSKEITFDAIFSKKLREKIANYIAEQGFDETLNNKKLMHAWRESIKRKETLLRLAIEQTNTYLNLIEKVLDRQREIAFVKAIYDALSEIDPSIAGKLYEKLERDEYARALLETSSVEEFINFIVSLHQKKQKALESTVEVSYEEIE